MGLGNLQWTTSNEVDNLNYAVMRSDDGVHFTQLVTFPAVGGSGGRGRPIPLPIRILSAPKPGTGSICFPPVPVETVVLYSLATATCHSKCGNVQNPFADHINVEMTAPANAVATINLVDMYGRYLRRYRQSLTQGLKQFHPL